MNKLVRKMLLGSIVMILANILVNLLIEGNVDSIISNPLRTLLSSIIFGMVIIGVIEWVKKTMLE